MAGAAFNCLRGKLLPLTEMYGCSLKADKVLIKTPLPLSVSLKAALALLTLLKSFIHHQMKLGTGSFCHFCENSGASCCRWRRQFAFICQGFIIFPLSDFCQRRSDENETAVSWFLSRLTRILFPHSFFFFKYFKNSVIATNSASLSSLF